MQMPILFFYALFFFFLYAILSVAPKRQDPLNLYDDIWLIGIFGLIHGLHEFIEFLIIVGGPLDVRLLQVIGSLLLPASFIFLIIFSTRVIIRRIPSFRWLRILWPMCLSVWAAVFILRKDLLIAAIAARYFVALPATLLVSFALYAALSKADKRQIPRGVYISAVAAIAAFSIYGILTGLVVPKADFLLARFINYPNFISFFVLPVQFFRMICAIIITASCMGILKLFHYEKITIKILLLMGAAIFLVELGIMFILSYIFPHLPVVTEAFLDSALLTALLYPLIYVMALSPLFIEIRERARAEEDLKNAYAKLQEIQDQLIQVEKLNAVGLLASGVAHEVKNPLGIILQGVNYMEKKVSSEEKDIFEVLDMIKNSIKRADKIINLLLDFSKAASLDLRSEDINSILENSVTLVTTRFKFENIEIIKEIKEGVPKVRADKDRMEQVFVNILLNAIQAMPEGGKIVLRTYDKKLEEVRNGVGRREEDYFKIGEKVVIVEIEDTGMGIPEENLKKIFDPFFTTRGPGGGTGLGLSVTRNILSMHKALIEVHSQVGAGTKVIITLKAAS